MNKRRVIKLFFSFFSLGAGSVTTAAFLLKPRVITLESLRKNKEETQTTIINIKEVGTSEFEKDVDLNEFIRRTNERLRKENNYEQYTERHV